MNNKDILFKEFILTKGNKNSFAQNPISWLENNGFSDYTHFFKNNDTSLIKIEIFKYILGIPKCIICEKEHTNLNPNWNGWQKTCSSNCLARLRSNRQLGEHNCMKKISNKRRQEIGEKIGTALKNKILNEGYSPKTENYKIYKTIKYNHNGKIYNFRSLWELLFFIQNPDLKYEFLRIKYYDTLKEKERIYITDFFDEKTNIIYEIKPKAYQKDQNSIDKANAASKKYKFQYIDDSYFNHLKSNEKIMSLVMLNTLNYEEVKQRFKWLKK